MTTRLNSRPRACLLKTVLRIREITPKSVDYGTDQRVLRVYTYSPRTSVRYYAS